MLQLNTDDLEQIKQDLHVEIDRLKNSNILITGGTGFFGKWIIGTLLYLNRYYNTNIKIDLITRNPENFIKEFHELKNEDSIKFIATSLQNLKLQHFDKEYQFVIHAATEVSNATNNEEQLYTTVQGTQNILNNLSIAQSSKASFLLISSGAVTVNDPFFSNLYSYDDQKKHDLNLNKMFYAQGKRMSELLVLDNHKRGLIDAKIARCFTFIGPHMPFNGRFAVSEFLSNAIANQPMAINGCYETFRSFLYMSDTVTWLLKLLVHPDRTNIVFNIGSEHPLRIHDLAILIKETLNSDSPIVLPSKNNIRDTQSYFVPKVKETICHLKVRQKIDLCDAILKTADWYIKYSQRT